MTAESYFYYRNLGRQPFGAPGWTATSVPGVPGGTNGIYTDLGNGFSATIFEKGEEYVVAFRGTDSWSVGQGDPGQNIFFGLWGVGEQTTSALMLVNRMIASGIDLSRISFTGHSLGGGLAGIAGGFFGRPATVFDPAPYNQELDDLAYDSHDEPEASVLAARYRANTAQYVDVYRVEGEILDIGFAQSSYTSKSYNLIDLGHSSLDDSGHSFANIVAQLYGEARQLHHISTMALAVLGQQGREGVGEAYQALVQQKDLLRRLIDDDLTGLKSLEQDAENNNAQDHSHGNFERMLALNTGLARDFGKSFKKTDNSTEDGGADNVGKSLLEVIPLRNRVIDLGFITARKLADRIDYRDPQGHSYDTSKSIFGNDDHSIVLDFKIITEVRPSDTADQKSRLAVVFDLLREALSIATFLSSNYDGGVLREQLAEAKEPGTDAKFIFGSIANAGSDYTLQSGEGTFIGGQLNDRFKGFTGDDVAFGAKGADSLMGEAGKDRLWGGDGNDTLLGGADDDELRGGENNDWLDGDKGTDDLRGEDGDDKLIAEVNDGDDTLSGGWGDDTVVYQWEQGNGLIRIVDAPFFSTILTGAQTPSDFGLVITGAKDDQGNVGTFGEDSLSSIEKAAVQAGSGTDRVLIDDDSQLDYIDYIDFGSQAAGQFDTVDLHLVTTKVFADLSLNKVEVKQPNPLTFGWTETTATLDVRNAEAVIGGTNDDILLGGVLTGVIPTYAGAGAARTSRDASIDVSGANGRRSLAGTKVQLDGGLGNDTVVLSAGEGSLAAGGLGRDVIINRSKKGQLAGDTPNGQYIVIEKDADGNDVAVPREVEDSAANADLFWWWPDTTILDAQRHDQLRFFGLPLTGGNNEPSIALGGGLFFSGGIGHQQLKNGLNSNGKFDPTLNIYFDKLFPSIGYIFKRQKDSTVDLYVFNRFEGLLNAQPIEFSPDDPRTLEDESQNLRGAMRIKNYEGYFTVSGSLQDAASRQSTFGMGFKVANPLFEILARLPQMLITFAASGGGALVDTALLLASAARQYAKAVKWSVPGDPLILDLDGDGIETYGIADTVVRFDGDGNRFAERTGWLSGDDGFLALDRNGNGRIDDGSELFGSAEVGGLAALAAYDSNSDGKITVADLIWSELKVWQDFDSDAVTDAGELKSLAAIGITSINLAGTALGLTTPQGAELLAYSSFTWDTGKVGTLFEAIFQTDNVDSRYNGESGLAAWQQGIRIDAKGFGTIADLAVATANDIDLGTLVAATAAAMTTPNLKTLREQAGAVLGKWGSTLETTRELAPVLLGTDSAGKTILADRAVYVEDSAGGYWTLASGARVLDAQGAAITRPTMEQVLAQGPGWRLEQAWSPSSRAAATKYRDEVPYLTRIVDGRAVILDHGVRNADGSWRLASGNPVRGADGQAIASPSRADILAMAHAAGEEWRSEDIGFNPYASIPVEAIGVRFTDGRVVDYTVEVTDRDGKFYVWARNLDRALELQFKTGDPREFNLRNYEVDFDKLDEVGSTDDSTYRVELLTPAQFHFATSLGGVDFRPQMLAATIDAASGQISYSVNDSGRASLATDRYDSPIKPMIEMIGLVMEQYVVTSRRFAVRLALQGGLKSFADGSIAYDVGADKYRATSNRELAPLFEAIFRQAPASNANDAAFDYLTDWNEILWQIYPDYALKGAGNLLGSTVQIDQAFIFQMLLPAFENVGIDLDIRAVANALSVDEAKIVTHSATQTSVDGTTKTDFFYMSEGNQTFRGGLGADYYFVGKNGGDDYIYDQDLGEHDELRFTALRADQVKARRDGQDLILEVKGTTRFLRITDQFLGELNGFTTAGKRFETGVNSIVFSDGVIWDRTKLAMEVVDRERAEGDHNDPLIGSGSGDVLWGGKGNDSMSGGAGGDVYIFGRGDGQDVIDERGGFSFGPVKAGIDFLQFRGDITADDLKLVRDGASSNLKIILLDKDGNETSDRLELLGQLGGITLGLGLFTELMGSSDGLDYVSPSLIERFIFEDGTALEFTDIVERVLRNAKTDGDDAIYGMLNANTLDGGKGKDFLTGFEGSDTYIFGRGYGKDEIEDNDTSFKAFSGPQHDTLKFIDDLRWSDLDFLREGSSDKLTLRIKGTADEVILDEYLKELPFIGYVNLLEDIVFGDGTQWSYLKLLQHYVNIGKTAGDDTIYGWEGIADSIDGGAGNDRLVGMSGSDTYVFGRGYGTDTILDSSGSERILFGDIATGEIAFSRTALDLILTVKATGERIVLENQYVRDGQQHHAVEYFEFADQTLIFSDFNPEDMDLVGTSAAETITGSNFGELIDGRAGDDRLIGGDGGDVYKFDVGYGNDVIEDRQIRSHWDDRKGYKVAVDDVVEFGDDIRYKVDKNVEFTKFGNDLIISVTDRPGHTLTIKNQFRSLEDGVEIFKFKDGSVLNIGDIEREARIEGGNFGDNRIEVSPLLMEVPNTLDGRQGDDTLYGGNAGDTYAFTTGYDFDKIHERPDRAGSIDRIVFGASVLRESLIVRRNGDDLVIDLGNGTDVVTIVGGLAGTRIEEFHFADGAPPMSLEQVIDRLLTGGAADEQLNGFDNRNDTLSGGAGSDALAGGLGNDVYRFGFGDGSDSISDTGGIDRIDFGPAVTQDQVTFRNVDGDLLIILKSDSDRIVILGGYSQKPVESFRFADGTSLDIAAVRALIRDQQPNGGQDLVDLRELGIEPTIEPGRGNDRLVMANDGRIVFHAGDGIDRVEMPSGVTRATVEFADLFSSDAVVRLAALDSNDLVIDFPATGDRVVIAAALAGGAVPSILFADGEAWDGAALIQRSVADQSSDGNDFIRGSSSADIVTGGTGDDRIAGNGGNDTYLFSIGDGRDVIDDSAGTDTLKISGYRPDEMRVSRSAPGRNELVLSFGDGSDEILLRYDGSLNGVDNVDFGDGTRFTRDGLFARIAGEGSDGDDRLTGTAGAETFTGGRGNDLMTGGGGGDVYKFSRGDGQDRIEANGSTDGLGTIEFGSGIVLEDISAKRDAAGNIVILVARSSDSITLVDVAGDPDPVVATLRFADGRSLSFAALAAAIAPTDGDDHIAFSNGATAGADLYGGLGNDWIEAGRGNDVLTGGKGNDRLEGQAGADTYFFQRGDGQDTIIDFDDTSSTAIDRIRFAAGILPTDIRVISVGPADLVIGLVGSDDRLIIRNMFTQGASGTDHGIEEFAFAGHPSLSLAGIYAAMGIGTDRDDTIEFPSSVEASVTLDGGKGDDTLGGGKGDNNYFFRRGDGRDTVRETNSSGSSDTLTFGPGIAPGDVVIIRDGDDLVLRLRGSDDRITLAGQALGTWTPIEEIVFDNGTTRWNAAKIAADAITPEAAERLFNPASGADPFGGALFAGAPGGAGGGTGGGDDEDDGDTGTGTGGGTGGGTGTGGSTPTETSDLLTGTEGNDRLLGLGGDDDLYGRGGDDELIGGTGVDDLYGEAGADRLYGDDGDDNIDGGTEDDLLSGGAGRDDLEAGAGHDTLLGGTGDDYLWGDIGDDLLYGGLGGDDIYGWDGDDHLIGDSEADMATRPSLDPDGTLAAYFGPIDKNLVTGLGGAAGFGETAVPSTSTFASVAIPAEFLAALTNGRVMIDGGVATSLSISDGRLTLGNLMVEVWNEDMMTSAGPGSASPGGNSTGSNRIWYDFDAATKTITVTWDDVEQAWDATERGPGNAFQAQIRILADNNLDVVFRYENLDWDEGYTIPYVRVRSNDAGAYLPWDGMAALDDTPGNTGVQGVVAFQVRGNQIVGLDQEPTWEDDTLYGGTGRDILEGGAGDDSLYGDAQDDRGTGGSGADYLDGGDGDDVLEGGSGYDNFWGGTGNDIMRGGADTDELYDDVGDDLLEGGDGNDEMDAGIGNDTMRGDAGADTIWDDEGNDIIDGGSGADTIWDGAGNDIIDGGSGGDVIRGWLGDDTIDGGSGDDVITDNYGTNVIRAGEGNDRIEISSSSVATTIHLGEGSDRVLQWKGSAFSSFAGTTIMDFAAGPGGDVIEFVPDAVATTSPLPYQIYLNQVGADVVIYYSRFTPAGPQASEAFRLVGVDGSQLTDDNFVGLPTWSDWGATAPVPLAFDGNETFIGSQISDIIEGGAGNDILDGGLKGHDVLAGGDGDDTLRSTRRGDGQAVMTGGEGRDRFEFLVPNGWTNSRQTDLITDFATGNAGDILAITLESRTRILVDQQGADTVIYVGSASTVELSQAFRLAVLQGVDASTLTLANFNGLAFESADGIVMTGDDLANTLIGSLGNDTISALGGDDRIEARNGDDALSGGDGNDVLLGEGGNDRLDGGAGEDLLNAGRGQNVLTGGAGRDTFFLDSNYYQDGPSRITDFQAGAGGDKVRFGWSSSLYSDSGSYVIVSQSGADTIVHYDESFNGNPYPDGFVLENVVASTLTSDNFQLGTTTTKIGVLQRDPITLVGTPGNDDLNGSLANDDIQGGYGQDVIRGLKGDDRLIGDSGIAQTEYPGFTTYFAGLTRDLVNGLGGQVGFGEAAVPRADFFATTVATVALPPEFSGGSLIVNNAPVTQVTIDPDGIVTIGVLKLAVWPSAGVDTDGGVLTPSSGGNSAGTKQVWYDFDSATSTITVTWDDVARYNSGTVPNAFQMQIKVLGPDRFDVIYRYEAIQWDWNGYAPYIENGTRTATFPMPSGGLVNLDTAIGGSGQPGLFVAQVRGTSIVTGIGYDNDIIYGGLGNDVIEGGLGADELRGESGNDSIDGGVGDDLIYGAEGIDTIVGGVGDDLIYGGEGIDTIAGGLGNDTINSESGNDIVSGGDGNDYISDGSSSDVIDAGAGDDTIDWGDGGDLITGGSGRDFFVDNTEVTGLHATITDFEVGAAGDYVRVHSSYRVTDSGRTGIVARQVGADVHIQARWDFASATVPVETRLILKNIQSSTLVAANFEGLTIILTDDQTIVGTTAAETLYGGWGNDTVSGSTGADTIYGSEGNDRLVGDSADPASGANPLVPYFGVLNSALVNGLGGAVGFGEQSLTRATTLTTTPAIPSTFNGGSVTVNGTASTTVSINNDGLVSIGSLRLGIWPQDVDTRGPTMTPSSGGTSQGTNLVYYDFDSATKTITVTWDDVGRATNGTVPNAFQMQLKVLGSGSFDVVYRYERLDWATTVIPYVEIAGKRFTMPVATANLASMDSAAGNLGLPGVWAFQIRGADYVSGTNVEGDVLDGGTGNDILEGGIGNDRLIAGTGADTLIGGVGDDQLEGLGGDADVDTLTGGAGRDEFRFLNVDTLASATAWAEDVITDFEAGTGGDRILIGGSVANPFATGQLIVRQSGLDTVVQFRSVDGVRRSVLRLRNVDATVLTPYNFGDLPFPLVLAVEIDDTDEGNVLAGSRDSDRIFGNGGADQISGFGGNDSLAGGSDSDIVRGEEGDDWIAGQEGHDTLAGGDGNDTISGGSGDDTIHGGDASAPGTGNDVIAGGTGDDTIHGGTGDDLYHFARGDGRDLIVDAGGSDRIRFAEGIATTDVTVVRSDGYIELRVADGSRIRVAALDDGSKGAIERVEFHGGAAWTWNELLSKSVLPDSVDQRLELTLPPGVISDDLIVNGGFETYSGQIWQAGWGLETYTVPGWTERFGNYYELVDSGHQGVVASEGVRWLDLDSAGYNMDVSQTVAGLSAGQQLVLEFDHANRTSAASGSFEVLWNDQVIATIAEGGIAMVTKTYLVTAVAGANVLRFRGLGAADSGGASLDNVQLRTLSATAYEPATLSGGAGNDILTGSVRDDILIGGIGDDRLAGGFGNDRYVFNRGDGQDVIADSQGANAIVFGADVTPDHVRLVRGSAGVVLEIIGTGDRIDLGSTASPTMAIQEVRFEDGTVWNAQTLIGMVLGSTTGDDLIYGTDGADSIGGSSGDDILHGRLGGDIIAGGAGADRAEGGGGSDVYRFARGDGQDVVLDSEGTDTIEFGELILPTDIVVMQSRDGANLILKLKESDQRITIENALGTGRIETIRFHNGTEWTQADLLGRLATGLDDVITGDSDANILRGGFGNDVLSGGGGADIYRYSRGDGRDVIRDGSVTSNDRIEIAGYVRADIRFVSRATGSNDVLIRFAQAGDEILVVDALASSAGADVIYLSDDGSTFTVDDIRTLLVGGDPTDGDDVLLGTSGNDVMAGGRGNDLVTGEAGNDVYLYRRGDGDDRIDAFGSGQDVVRLVDYNAVDISSAVRSGPDGEDLVIYFKQAGDRLVLRDALGAANGSTNSLTIEFKDGTSWDRAAMRGRAVADVDGIGGDNVYGFDGADHFAAKSGDDFLSGGAGSDSYVFAKGSGNDTVHDLSTSTSFTDSLQFLDFRSTEVSVTRLFRGSETVVIRFESSKTDSVTVIDALALDRRGIETYTFADGIVWTRDKLRELLDNNAPVAADDGYYSVVTGLPLTIRASDLLRNDLDADGDTLRVVAVDGGEHGVATIAANGDIQFTATAGYYGPATLTYTVSDGRHGFADASIDVRVRPIATAFEDRGFTVTEDGFLNIRVERLLSNDLDGDRMIVAQVFGAVGGTVALSSNGDIGFTPSANFNGVAEFTYVANTPEGGRAEAKAYINVSAVNDAPVARSDGGIITSEGAGFDIDPRALLGNDSDVDGDVLTLDSVIPNQELNVSIGPNGTIRVVPRAYFWGSTHFDYVVADPSGAKSTARVSVTVTPVNDAPEAYDDRFETTQEGGPIREDNPIVISAERLLANDIERDGETMSVIDVGNTHGGRARLLNNATVLFEPFANFNGDAWFDYKISDGHGGSSWARATIAYAPENDRPVARDDHYSSPSLYFLKGFEDQAIEIPLTELLKNDFDVEGFLVKFENFSNAIWGDVVLTPRNTLIFTPDKDFWGAASFDYLISDPEGAVSDAKVTLWFENVGDGPPVAVKDTIYVYEDVPTVIPIAALLGNDTDIDRDPIRFVGFEALRGLHGRLEYDQNGDILFTPFTDADSSSGLRYTITDDRDGSAVGEVDIVIIPSNDDPTAVNDEGFVTPLDIPLVIRASDLVFNDFDIEQADGDGDGAPDHDFDDPDRPRPRFVGVTAILDPVQLAQGNRVSVGEFEVVEYRGEKFIVVRFPTGFSGQVTIEYKIADAQGLTDVGFAEANVADFYNGVLRGLPLVDYIVGGAGADTIRSFQSDDFILAMGGNDVIETGLGRDDIDAGDGDDVIDGGADGDTITGGSGFDTVVFTGSNVGIRADLESRVGQGGVAENDVYTGIEALVGTEYDDTLGGDGVANRLEGRDGNDRLEGRGGNDVLLGGAGKDVLEGGAGADRLDGGEGSDTASYFLSATGVT
ncbi:MAG TPA: tandem-95 repeat protein, partial [Allosphingosinicella sp.]